MRGPVVGVFVDCARQIANGRIACFNAVIFQTQCSDCRSGAAGIRTVIHNSALAIEISRHVPHLKARRPIQGSHIVGIAFNTPLGIYNCGCSPPDAPVILGQRGQDISIIRLFLHRPFQPSLGIVYIPFALQHVQCPQRVRRTSQWIVFDSRF